MYNEDNCKSQEITGALGINKPLPLLEKLTRERDGVQNKLNEYNAAIEALEKHPEYEVLMNTLNKVLRSY